jgi:S1-C subfamily serine protease
VKQKGGTVSMFRKSVQIPLLLTGLVILVTLTAGATARAQHSGCCVTPRAAQKIEVEREPLPSVSNFLGFSVSDLPGVLVGDVDPASIAGMAGFHRGDVILAVNGEPVHNIEDFQKMTNRLSGGVPVSFTIMQNGQVNFISIH